MLSYKEIIKANEAFANNHFAIENFEAGEVWQLTNHDEFQSFKYTLMFMEREPSSFSQGEFVYTFRVWFLTRVESPKDRNGLLFQEYTDAISNMTSIAQNFIAYWKQDVNYPELQFDIVGSVEPETDVTPDRISGVSIICNFRVNFNYDNCLIPMASAPAPESGDVVITINGSTWETYLPGTTDDIPVIDQNDNPVGSKVGDSWVVNTSGDPVSQKVNGVDVTDTPAGDLVTYSVLNSTGLFGIVGTVSTDTANVKIVTIGDTNVSNSDDSYDVDVPAEDNLEIPDIEVTDSDGSTFNWPAAKDVVCTPAAAPGSTGGIYKSGADTSYETGDEGDDPSGIGTNWFNLGFNNPFGNAFRFTGTTGGYTDGTNYFDVSGVGTTKALAFPDDIMLDWSTYNQSASNVFALRFNPLPTDSMVDHLAAQPYTYDSKSDWMVITLRELWNISKTDTSVNGWLDYLPVDRPYSSPSDRIWTRTPADISDFYHFWTAFFTSRTSKTTSYETYVTRLYTLTELGIV